MVVGDGQAVGLLGVPDMAHENWRPIPGFDGLYSASDLGNVRSEGRTVTPADGSKPYMLRARIMRPTPDRLGYLRVNLRFKGRTVYTSVHRCVALAFHGPCPAGMECRHKNGVPGDCRADNLHYGTRSQNIADAKRHGTFPLGADRPRARITAPDARAIFLSTDSAEDVARRYGISARHVHVIWSGRAWSEFTNDLSPPIRKPGGRSKITAANARAIFTSSETNDEAAARYGLTWEAVHNIRRGKSWREVTTGLKQPRRPRTVANHGVPDDTVRAVLADSGTYGRIAVRYGVSRQTVYLIKNGKTRKNITRPQAVGADPTTVGGPDLVVGGAAEGGAVGKDDLDDD
jgi:hypothetical protein